MWARGCLGYLGDFGGIVGPRGPRARFYRFLRRLRFLCGFHTVATHVFHSIIIAGFPASWWWVYTPTELGVFGGSGDFGCFNCFGGSHDVLPMLRHCAPPARGFRCSKHGFCVLEALQQPDFPPKPCLAGMRHGEPIEASVEQPQPSTTPQPCRMFAKHGFHFGRPQTPGETTHNTQTPCLEEMQHDKSWRQHLKPDGQQNR